ncbi:MAG: hypothetical protein BMS9Abin36_0780 [Gammaproteobacteria bacterium]|nr:MAG: hypothetical protein BMS9Abin36_0780 [Gammaproteobacteria bacterium]
MTVSNDYIRWFSDVGLNDVAVVGGKNASLGEMVRELAPQGIKVPNGFAITAQAYRDVVDSGEVLSRLRVLMADVNKDDIADLSRRGREARRLVFEAGLPDALRDAILDAYHKLLDEYGTETAVAVRSSATAEDLPEASFAGQQESYLNVSGDEMLLESCRCCFASLFADRAIAYRIDHGFDHFSVALSIGVQKMVRSDRATSGVMFTLDTESGHRDVVFITGAYGLGENVVQGAVDPDEFYIHKPTFNKGYRAVLRRVMGRKQVKMVYAADRTHGGTRNIPTPSRDRRRFCLTDEEVFTLAQYALTVEQHYSIQAGHDVAHGHGMGQGRDRW